MKNSLKRFIALFLVSAIVVLIPLTCSKSVYSDTEIDASRFVDTLFIAMTGSIPSEERTDVLKSRLASGEITGIDAAHQVFFSTEVLNSTDNGKEFVARVISAGNGIPGSPDAVRLQVLSENNPSFNRNKAFKWYINTPAFINLCEECHVTMGTYDDGRVIYWDRPMIALTFDDGPGDRTNEILDCLERYGQAATFFVVGYNAVNYRDAIRRADFIGCEVGSHTAGHADLATLSVSEINDQFFDVDKIIFEATGHHTTVLRPPYGSFNDRVRSVINVPLVLWNIDTEDWATHDTESTIDHVVGVVYDGDIVLMHDIHVSTVDAALVIIPALVEEGYQLVTMSEIASHRGGMVAGGAYYRFRPL